LASHPATRHRTLNGRFAEANPHDLPFERGASCIELDHLDLFARPRNAACLAHRELDEPGTGNESASTPLRQRSLEAPKILIERDDDDTMKLGRDGNELIGRGATQRIPDERPS
jgi:hypothetical protein